MRGVNFIARVLAIASSVSAFSLPAMTPYLAAARINSLRMTADAAVASTCNEVKPQRVTVVGGGPAGAMMALYLTEAGGYEVDLFEALEESRIAGPTSRSWNILLFERGCKALEEGGFDLLKEAGDAVVEVCGSVRHNAEKKASVSFSLGSKSVCRGDLAIALLKKAQRSPNVNVHFGCTLLEMDVQKRVAAFERQNGEVFKSSFDMLVGADGVNSRVRQALQDQAPGFTVRQHEGPKAFKTFEVPIMGTEEAEESWKSFTHSSNSKKGQIFGSPRSDGVMSAALLLPMEGKMTFETLMKTTEDVRDFFGSNHRGLFGPKGPNEQFARQFLEQRPKLLKTTFCSQLALGSVVLIGDAGHAMQASLGQGVNCALEDCQVLAQLLAAEREKTDATQVFDIPGVLEAYSKLRLEDVHAVCTLSDIAATIAVRKRLAAQIMLTVMLNKTFGRLAPKVFRSCSLFTVNQGNTSYRVAMQEYNRESAVNKRVLVASSVVVIAGLARRVFLRV